MLHQAASDFLVGVAAAVDPVTRFRLTIGEPDAYQVELLNTDPKRDADDQFVTCLASRQVGKSTTIASLAWEDLCQHKTVLLTAPSQRQSIELLRRVVDFKNADPFAPLVKVNKTEIECLNGPGRIVSIPATDNARGFTADTIVIDEAAFIEDDAITAILPMRADAGRVLMISTPAGRSGFFYDIWSGKKGRRVFARSVDIARLEAKVEYDRRFMNDVRFRQEHLCEFLGAGTPLISFDTLDRASNPSVGALQLS